MLEALQGGLQPVCDLSVCEVDSLGTSKSHFVICNIKKTASTLKGVFKDLPAT